MKWILVAALASLSCGGIIEDPRLGDTLNAPGDSEMSGDDATGGDAAAGGDDTTGGDDSGHGNGDSANNGDTWAANPPTATVTPATNLPLTELVDLMGMTCTVDTCDAGGCTIAWTMPTRPGGDSGAFSDPAASPTNYGATISGSYNARCRVTDALGQFADANTGVMVVSPALAGEPYDLTPYEADMVLAFDNNGIARPQWPTPPAYDDTPCIVAAGDEASLNACLDLPGKHIIIPAGDYTGPFTFDRSDQWIDMDNGANLTGNITLGGAADRVKITGGNFIGGRVQNAGVDDLLIDNVNMYLLDLVTPNRNSFLTCVTGFNCARMAIINTTCHATTTCALTNPTPKGSSTSLIMANFDAWSEFVNGTGNDEFVSRLQNTDRVMIVDSHFRVYPTSKPPQRFHYGSTATLLVNNIFEGSGTGFTNFWIDTDAGSGERDDIDNMFILRNDFYQHSSTKLADINIDDSLPGNGIDVVLVHLEGNVSHHINTDSFVIAGNWNGAGQDCGGRDPCLRNINNTGLIVPGLTLIPFVGGANH